jgi:hypothetical protein
MGNNCFYDIITSDSQQLSHEINDKKLDLIIEKTQNSLNGKSDLDKKFSLKKKLSDKKKLLNSKKTIIDTQALTRKNVKNYGINTSKNEEIKEDYEKSILTIIKKHNRNNEDNNLINNCLIKHFFMKDLDKQARNAIIQEMSLSSVQENIYI